uniref:Uncharacterized protein n=1 Tax=uncultured marine bacterium Ant4E12 TaxID=360424 RepID=Q2PYH1_9BACT|nr:hypothetical protein [uncultured marine bacterium Ant4E12]
MAIEESLRRDRDQKAITPRISLAVVTRDQSARKMVAKVVALLGAAQVEDRATPQRGLG